jgi:hypothetical protein
MLHPIRVAPRHLSLPKEPTLETIQDQKAAVLSSLASAITCINDGTREIEASIDQLSNTFATSTIVTDDTEAAAKEIERRAMAISGARYTPRPKACEAHTSTTTPFYSVPGLTPLSASWSGINGFPLVETSCDARRAVALCGTTTLGEPIVWHRSSATVVAYTLAGPRLCCTLPIQETTGDVVVFMTAHHIVVSTSFGSVYIVDPARAVDLYPCTAPPPPFAGAIVLTLHTYRTVAAVVPCVYRLGAIDESPPVYGIICPARATSAYVEAVTTARALVTTAANDAMVAASAIRSPLTAPLFSDQFKLTTAEFSTSIKKDIAKVAATIRDWQTVMNGLPVTDTDAIARDIVTQRNATWREPSTLTPWEAEYTPLENNAYEPTPFSKHDTQPSPLGCIVTWKTSDGTHALGTYCPSLRRIFVVSTTGAATTLPHTPQCHAMAAHGDGLLAFCTDDAVQLVSLDLRRPPTYETLLSHKTMKFKSTTAGGLVKETNPLNIATHAAGIPIAAAIITEHLARAVEASDEAACKILCAQSILKYIDDKVNTHAHKLEPTSDGGESKTGTDTETETETEIGTERRSRRARHLEDDSDEKTRVQEHTDTAPMLPWVARRCAHPYMHLCTQPEASILSDCIKYNLPQECYPIMSVLCVDVQKIEESLFIAMCIPNLVLVAKVVYRDSLTTPGVPTVTNDACSAMVNMENVKDVVWHKGIPGMLICRRFSSQMVTPLSVKAASGTLTITAFDDINPSMSSTFTRQESRPVVTGDATETKVYLCTTAPRAITVLTLCHVV